MRGINDDEIVDFARLTLEHPWHVRFIELMPVGDMRELDVGARRAERRDPRATRARSRRSTPAPGPARGNGPAAYYHVARRGGNDRRDHADDAHVLRVVQPGAPHRRRPSAHVPVRRSRGGSPRRRCARAQPLEPFFRDALADKPKEHELLQMQVGGLRALSQVGG